MENERLLAKNILGDLLEIGRFFFDPFIRKGKNFKFFIREHGHTCWLSISFSRKGENGSVRISGGYSGKNIEGENQYPDFIRGIALSYFLKEYDDIFLSILEMNIGKNFKFGDDWNGRVNKKNITVLKNFLLNVVLYKILKFDSHRVFFFSKECPDDLPFPGYLYITKNHPQDVPVMSLQFYFHNRQVLSDGFSFRVAKIHLPHNALISVVRREFKKIGITF